ncbi:MAG: MMPL family transporter [Mycobacteriales bacterium]
MVRLAEFVLRHKTLVTVCWLLALLAGAATAGATTERLTFDFSLPGQQGYETEKQLLEIYGNGPDEGTTLVVVTAPGGSTVADHREQVDAVFRGIDAQFPQYRVLWSGIAGAAADRFRAEDGRTAYGVVVDERFTGFTFEPAFRTLTPYLAEQEQRTGLDVRTTGYFQLSEGNAGSGAEAEPPSVLSETLLGAAGALVVLLFVFASFLALVPLLVAAVSILSTFLCVLALSYLTDVSFVVQFLVALVGLGLAIDYSLLVVTRWREEREHGAGNDAAVVESMRTAGHAVLASAGTVAISLVALVVVPVPFLRSMGFGGMLIPVVSAAVVLTLLPAVLAGVGPRVDWPRIRHENSASRGWTAWARGITRRRWLAAAVGTALLGALVAPVFGITVGQPRTESLATRGPAVETLADLHDGGVPRGVVTPLEVLLRGDDTGAGAQEVVRLLNGVDGVAFAVAPDGWRLPDSSVVHVVPDEELVDLQRAGVVERIRDAIAPVPGVVGVAGPGATVLDYNDAVFARFPLVMALIALTTFLLLVRAFRSLLLPLKAVLLNVVSVAATFGFVVLFWQEGLGSEQVFGIAETGAVTFWLPVLIFAFLFGLSMDYEVFILSRMREEYDRSGSTRTAVVEGLGRTGRLVTCAALILFLAFTALASAPGTDIKILATALGVGILIDATIVRALLVPALVSLLGEWNWWLPSWLARALWVEPSPRIPEPLEVPGRRAAAASRSAERRPGPSRGRTQSHGHS